MWPKLTILLLMMMSAAEIHCQQDSLLVLSGRVLCSGRPVPYAALQLQGSSVGVHCNDAGEYLLKIPQGRERDTVTVRSLGYEGRKVPVGKLLKNGDVRLKARAIELKTVTVSDYGTAYQLLLAAVEGIKQIYHQQTAWSTFFYRDWRAVDGELFLFDEAVMCVQRCPYSQYADKRGYLLDPSQREMESNIKTILRHRLLVYDRKLLENKIVRGRGCDQMLAYSDNVDFFDPVATPQASYALAERILRQHRFEPIRTFVDDGEVYYLLRSVGPCRTPKARTNYEYTIRRRDLALVRLVSSKQTFRHRAPTDPWVNWYYNTMIDETDSSVWTYAVRNGHYTLTHYYNATSSRLESSRNGHDGDKQHWMQCHEWVLTDFDMIDANGNNDENNDRQVPVHPQVLPSAFGISSYDKDFWGRYNTIPIDSLPLQLLKQKYSKATSKKSFN